MIPSLIDANVFITAKRDQYRFNVVPGFWDWLVRAHAAGEIYSIDKIRDELLKQADQLATWVQSLPASFFLATDASVAQSAAALSAWATTQIYEQQAISAFFASADYWLIAHAMARGWRVVTHERPAPGSRKTIKIPDACNGMRVTCISPYDMLEDLGARFVL